MIHIKRLWQSPHSFWRRVAFMIEFTYNAINLIFGWFAMGNFYIFFVILTSSLAGPEFDLKGITIWNTILQYLYLGALVACFIFGLGNRPQGSPWKYRALIYFFGVMTF
jgi:chitin synthase